MKTKWTLNGLDCASCAKKIEDNANKLPNIEVVLNFVNSSLTINYLNENSLKEIESIINKIEPDVIIIKNETRVTEQISLDIYNLDCASCALEIEQGLEKLDNIATVNVNFTTSKINFTLLDNNIRNTTISNVKKRSIEIESDVSFIPLEIKDNILKRYGLLISIVFFIVGWFLPQPYSNVSFIFSYLVVGYKVIFKAINNMVKGKVFDENFLMSIATLGAFIIGDFGEGAAVMLFYAVGELFQSYAVNKSRNSISALMDINADHANLIIGDEIQVLDPKDIKIGDIILLKSGERVPLDGICLSDSGTIDNSALSGESVPISVGIGTSVLSGCINLSTAIKLEVTKEYGDSTVSRILELVENASSKKAPTEQFMTKFARIYTPVVVIAALLITIIPPILNMGTFNQWLYRACVFLVVSCPCALVVSIPLALFAGLGSASKHGILIKGGNYLEALCNVDTVVFDKTGTLTKGTFSVNSISSINIREEQLLKIAAYGESLSTHPIAKSIVSAYNLAIDNSKITSIEEISGKGIKAKMFDHTYFLGNANLMMNNNCAASLIDDGTIVHIMEDNIYLGYIKVSDEVKEDSKLAINQLRALGVKKCVMLSGDHDSIVSAVGNQLGLDEVYGHLLPEQKVIKLEEIIKNSVGKVIFVGDGINDAPVLARSDIGVAMGAMGSEAAIQAADVVLMNDTPTSLPMAIKISTKTKRILYQNIIISLGVKATVLVMALLGVASMWLGVFADVGVTLLAVMNSMRALK